MLPRISILMPSLNGAQHIAAALDSIMRQGYSDLEVLALDACSTDGTLDILARYPLIQTRSEPDAGAHDALNKGLGLASGEIIGFLAVDDIFPDGAFADVGRLFAERPDVDVVVGHSLVFTEESGRRVKHFVRRHAKGDGLWLPELTFGVPGFFGCFFRKRVFDRLGAFDNSYTFAGDRHFLMRIALRGLKSTQIDRPTILYRMHSGSQTINPAMRNLLPMSEEYVRMSLELAAEAEPKDRPVFTAWHAFESVKLTVRKAMRGQLAGAACVATQLSTRNPLWPLHLIRAFALRNAVMWLDRQ